MFPSDGTLGGGLRVVLEPLVFFHRPFKVLFVFLLFILHFHKLPLIIYGALHLFEHLVFLSPPLLELLYTPSSNFFPFLFGKVEPN